MATYTDPTVVAVGKSNKVQPGPVIALIAGLFALLIAAFFFVETLSSRDIKTKLDADIQTKEAQVSALKSTADELDLLSRQSSQLHTLFSNQKRWDLILSKIEERLYKHMTVTAMTLNADGTFALTGTTPSYTDYAKIFNSLTDGDGQKYFAQAKPVSVSRTDETATQPAQIGFTFNLILNPSVLNLTAGNN